MMLDMALSIPQTKEYLKKVPQGLKSLASSFGTEKCYIVIGIKPLETGEEKGVISIMAHVDGKLSTLKDANGNPAEYIIDESAIAMIREKMDREREDN